MALFKGRRERGGGVVSSYAALGVIRPSPPRFHPGHTSPAQYLYKILFEFLSTKLLNARVLRNFEVMLR
jgi:hypothetical protein